MRNWISPHIMLQSELIARLEAHRLGTTQDPTPSNRYLLSSVSCHICREESIPSARGWLPRVLQGHRLSLPSTGLLGGQVPSTILTVFHFLCLQRRSPVYLAAPCTVHLLADLFRPDQQPSPAAGQD